MMIKIAIDGPAGAGKSTAAKILAGRLGINYMDTGAMYRATALALLRRGINVADAETVCKKLPELDIEIVYDERGQRVFADGSDVTDFIRTSEVTKASSDVAVIPDVRLKLVEIQRAAADKYPIVMDGRDIGTYVLPDAPVKFFITATPEERALRRQKELAASGVEKPLETLVSEITARDETDTNREFAPLRRADDALLLDTTELSIEEVTQAMLDRVAEVWPDV